MRTFHLWIAKSLVSGGVSPHAPIPFSLRSWRASGIRHSGELDASVQYELLFETMTSTRSGFSWAIVNYTLSYCSDGSGASYKTINHILIHVRDCFDILRLGKIINGDGENLWNGDQL